MQKFTGRGKRAALFDVEEPGGSYRLETVDIPYPILEKTSGEEEAEADRSGPFLRTRERVPVRRRSRSRFAWTNRWERIAAVSVVLATLGMLSAIAWEIETVLRNNARFELTSARDIQLTGNRVVSSRQVRAIFASDMGHSIFRVPLAMRQKELQGIDWVRAATVMRVWPNRLHVTLVERTPIAFAREGNSVRLVDQDGVLLDLPDAAAQRYSFPVLSGISGSDPASTRAARMQLYRQLIDALDADGEHLSADVSEVDLSDPEDLRAVFTGGARDPVVHLGDTDFLARYRAYRTHLTEWLQQYPQLRSVDMRYGKQIVLDTGTQSSSEEDGLANKGAGPVDGQIGNAGDKTKGGSHPAKLSSRAARPASKPAKVRAAKQTGRPKASAAAKRHARTHKRSPERGHTVHDPIAHAIGGA